MLKKILILLAAAFAIFGAGILAVSYDWKLDPKKVSIQTLETEKIAPPESSQERALPENESVEKAEPAGPLEVPSQSSPLATDVQLAVPFAVQAPFGNWSDPIFQDACEEASIVMALGWLKGAEAISPESAEAQIQDIVKYENKTFGYNADSDLADVAKILRDHFEVGGVEIKEDIELVDIISELQEGRLVLVPAFGRALGNSFYTPPGPIEHMLVITGYDSKAKKIITNDPGTKRGAGYKYDEKVLFDAIWTYPSGSEKVPAPEKASMKKAMLVISPN